MPYFASSSMCCNCLLPAGVLQAGSAVLQNEFDLLGRNYGRQFCVWVLSHRYAGADVISAHISSLLCVFTGYACAAAAAAAAVITAAAVTTVAAAVAAAAATASSSSSAAASTSAAAAVAAVVFIKFLSLVITWLIFCF